MKILMKMKSVENREAAIRCIKNIGVRFIVDKILVNCLQSNFFVFTKKVHFFMFFQDFSLHLIKMTS